MRRVGVPTRTVPIALAIMLCGALVSIVLAAAVPAGAEAEQASAPSSPAAGQLDAGGLHSCSLDAGEVRCWGAGNSGQLGYADARSIGDDEPPGAAGPVDLGPGRFATAISAGDFHTCALLDDGSVRCWGFGGDGRLGYANTRNVGDDESPASAGRVNLGQGHTAVAITAGGAHSCAVLDTGRVLCWGFGEDGRLGYGDESSIGDDETPGQLAPVNLGPRRATAISAGAAHTCALLDDGSVRCWGTNGPLFGGDGRLGYGNATAIGDSEAPAEVDPVQLGGVATAISAGDFHTCAVLVGGSVRCWGNGVDGRLGYGDERAIGDNEHPDSVGPVNLGGAATAISAGNHTCALLIGGAVHCWGPGAGGRLGYGGTSDVGDDEDPGSVGPVSLGAPATAISAGSAHTCAALAGAGLRCWGAGAFGRLGYGNQADVGDDEPAAAAGLVDLDTRGVSIADAAVLEGDAGQTAMTFTVRLSAPSATPTSVSFVSADDSAGAPSDYAPRSGTLAFDAGDTTKTLTLQVEADVADEPDERLLVTLHDPVGLAILDAQASGAIVDDDTAVALAPPPPAAVDPLDEALRRQARRAADLRACRRSATDKRRAARSSARRRHRRQPRVLARVLRQIDRTAAQRRARCVKTFGRTPGRVTSLVARRSSATSIVLAFDAPGSDGSQLPAAQGYLVKQSLRPIRSTRDFDRARALCSGTCRFDVMRVGGEVRLSVDDLRRRTTYHYAVAARDNVSARRGPRSRTIAIRTG